MILNQINLRKTSKDSILKMHDNNTLAFSNLEKKELQKIIISEMLAGRFTTALNATTIGFLIDKESTFRTIRSKGLFRYSTYFNKKCIVKDIAIEAQKTLNRGQSDDIEIGYLRAIITYSFIHQHYQALKQAIIQEIKSFEKKYVNASLLKTLIVFADFMFLTNHQPDDKRDTASIKSRTKEDISSAVSYLVFILSSIKSFNSSDAARIATDYIMKGGITKIILFALFVEDYKEIEILIDNFGYTLEYSSDDTLKLSPPTEDFEKLMRLGYIKSDIQSINDSIRFFQEAFFENALSFDKMIEELMGIEEMQFLRFTTTGNYPRYVLAIPQELSDYLTEKLFKSDDLFQDEVFHLDKIFKEQLMEADSLDKIVKGSLTLLEFLKIRRLFVFINTLFYKELNKLDSNAKTEHVLQSIVPILKEEVLYNLLSNITTPEKIDDFFDIVCWEQGSDRIFDLQYQSILFIDDTFLMPTNILTQSNAVRNLYASEYKKQNPNLFSDGQVDRLTDILADSFKTAGFKTLKQIKYNGGDIDLVVEINNALVFIECKQTLHPTSPYELRTTYDYIKKAQRQLDKILYSYENQDLKSKLIYKFGYKLDHIKKILTIVVLSNRFFCGNLFKHPVRSFHELKNLVEEGLMRTENGNYSLWSGNCFSLSELEAYLDDKNERHNHIFHNLKSYTMIYDSCNPKIEYTSYYVDGAEASKNLMEITKHLRKMPD
jgi:hypothetical protein